MTDKITQPRPEEVTQARVAVGHTQGQAADTVHAGSYRTWQDWEAGRRSMPMAAWELYLLKTDQKAPNSKE